MDKSPQIFFDRLGPNTTMITTVNMEEEEEEEEESMEIEEPSWVRSVIDDPEKYFYSTRKHYPPPPDGLVSGRILPDGSNTVIFKTTAQSEEILLPTDEEVLAALAPGEKRVLYSGTMDFANQQ